MGKQVNFFMLEDDEAQFVGQIKAVGGRLCALRNPMPELTVYTHLPALEGPSGIEICLVPKDRELDVIIGKSPILGRYLVDEENSPVVQFRRCRRSETALYRGRIWAQMEGRIYQEGEERIVTKGRDFELFYDSLARWVRKNFQRDPVTGFWCGPQAWSWRENNGELRQF